MFIRPNAKKFLGRMSEDAPKTSELHTWEARDPNETSVREHERSFCRYTIDSQAGVFCLVILQDRNFETHRMQTFTHP